MVYTHLHTSAADSITLLSIELNSEKILYFCLKQHLFSINMTPRLGLDSVLMDFLLVFLI